MCCWQCNKDVTRTRLAFCRCLHEHCVFYQQHTVHMIFDCQDASAQGNECTAPACVLYSKDLREQCEPRLHQTIPRAQTPQFSSLRVRRERWGPNIQFQNEIQKQYIWIWKDFWRYETLETVISSTGIFVEIDNNTLYGSKLYIFISCQNH